MNITNQLIKSQSLRVFYNYSRMLITFAIGLLIIKHLVSIDQTLYTAYALVTMGLAIGVITREIIRAALVPFLTANLQDDTVDPPRRFRQSLTITLMAILACLTLGAVVIQFQAYFHIDDRWKSSFTTFFWLRCAGYSILMISVPVLNVYALKGWMGLYNFSLLTERLIDFIAVETVFWLLSAREITQALLVNGVVYVLLCFIYIAVLTYFFRRKMPRSYKPLPAGLDIQTRQFIKQQIAGVFLFVMNMSLYFRFSLVLVNWLFGESFSFIYAIAVQVASYLRQAVMGIITGIDSFFSGFNHSKESEDAKQSLLFFGKLNAMLLLPTAIIMYLLFPFLLEKLLGSEVLENNSGIVLLSRLFLIGICIRSLSEHWMQYLNGLGHVSRYSRKLIRVAVFSPLIIAIIHYTGVEKPVLLLGLLFLMSMLISHLILVPLTYARIAAEPYYTTVLPIFSETALYTVWAGLFVVWQANPLVTVSAVLLLFLVNISVFTAKAGGKRVF